MADEQTNTDELNVEDKQIKYGIFHRKTKFAEGAELFPRDGKPSPLDVKQGYTDLDCYFLSVLASLANTEKGKEQIMACFPDYKDVATKTNVLERIDWFKNLEDNKIKIQFFKPDSKSKITIIVDKTALRGKGAPWVRLLEKAYTIYKIKYLDDPYFEKLRDKHEIKSRAIDGSKDADSAYCVMAITGEAYDKVLVKHNIQREGIEKTSGPYDEALKAVFTNIEKGLSDGKSVVADAEKGNKIYSKGLFLKHSYTILYTVEIGGKKYIAVRNPYVGRSRVYEIGSDGKIRSKAVVHKEEYRKGVSVLELRCFCEWFSSYTVGTKYHEI